MPSLTRKASVRILATLPIPRHGHTPHLVHLSAVSEGKRWCGVVIVKATEVEERAQGGPYQDLGLRRERYRVVEAEVLALLAHTAHRHVVVLVGGLSPILSHHHRSDGDRDPFPPRRHGRMAWGNLDATATHVRDLRQDFRGLVAEIAACRARCRLDQDADSEV